MKNRVLHQSVAILLATLLLQACGGGGGDSTVSQTVIEPKVSGQVADGYLMGAKVFWDCNSNQSWDSTEAFVITGGDGKFEISAQNCNLVVYVPATAIDQDTGISVGRSYTMLTPKGSEAFISPLTTLVQARSIELREQSTTIDVARQQAIAEIQSATGLSNLNANYLDTNTLLVDAAKAHNTAKILAQIYQDPVSFPVGKANAIIKNIQSIASQIPNINKGLWDLQPLYANVSYDNSAHGKSRVRLKNTVKEGLTQVQVKALQSVVDNSDVRKSAFDSQINWTMLNREQRKVLLKTLKDAQVVPKNTELLAEYISGRQQQIFEAQDTFELRMNGSNQIFSHDPTENLRLIRDTALTAANAGINTASLLIPAASAVNVDYVFDNPSVANLQGLIKSLDDTPLMDSLSLTSDASDLLEDIRNGKLKKLDAAKSATLVKFGADALAIISKKFGDGAKLTSLFSSSVDDADASDKLETIFSGFELLGDLTQNSALKNAAGLLKNYLEAYNRGQEYAEAVDKEVFAKQQQIQADFDRWTKSIFNAFDDNRLSLLVHDYVEFLPAGACAEGTWEGGNGSCVPLDGSYAIIATDPMPLLGETITFKIDAAVDYVKSVVWKVGDTIMQTLNGIAEVFTHIFQTIGEFVVSATLQNQLGQEVAYTSITVNTQLPLIASLEGTTTTAYVGQDVSIVWSNSSAKNEAKLCQFSIDFGNGLDGGGGDCDLIGQIDKIPLTTQYTQAGEYTIRLTVKDSEGRMANTTWTIEVKPAANLNPIYEKPETLTFDGIKDVVQENVLALNKDFGAFTASTMVYFNSIDPDVYGKEWKAIFTKRYAGQSFGLMMFMGRSTSCADGLCPANNGHVLRVYAQGLSANSADYVWTDIQAKRWYHVAYTYDGANIKIYIDGVLKVTQPSTGAITGNSYSLNIGRNDGIYPYYLGGQLKQLKIYDRALSQVEVASLSAYSGTFTVPATSSTGVAFASPSSTKPLQCSFTATGLVSEVSNKTPYIGPNGDGVEWRMGLHARRKSGVNDFVGINGRLSLQPNDSVSFFAMDSTYSDNKGQFDVTYTCSEIQQPTWTPNPANGHQYAAVDCGTWTQCEAQAVASGAHLVSVNDAAENAWLVSTFTPTKNYWIGLTDKDQEGVWKWTSGEAFGYSNWISGEPSNGGGGTSAESYVHMNFNYLSRTNLIGKWNDTQNDITGTGIGGIPYNSSAMGLFERPAQPTWTTNPANGHQYAAVDCGTWTQCEAQAVASGAHLVSVNDAAENAWLLSTFNQPKNYWIGLTDKDQEGVWKWTSGEVFSYSNWNLGEPNNGSGIEDYVHMNLYGYGEKYGNTGEWNDTVNDIVGTPYFSPVPAMGLFEKNDKIGIWEARTSTSTAKYATTYVDSTNGYITYSGVKSGWANFRTRFEPISGDNIHLEVRGKNDPALGGVSDYDFDVGLSNESLTGLYDANGIEKATSVFSYAGRNALNDVFAYSSDTTTSPVLSLSSSSLKSTSWHNYIFETKNNSIYIYFDGVLKYTQPYTGKFGLMSNILISGKGNVQFDPASVKVSANP
ncbi:MAG: lectin-like protein [Agitococcus sp.]|nr:lectin-like protein [Agitococcus sp.]